MSDAAHDIALFHKIKENNRLALNTLFAQYYTSLCSFAHTYLQNQEEAEECVSDVFFNLWKNRRQLEIERNFRSYLYISVKHSALACLRKKKIEFEEIDEAIESTVSDTVDPHHLLDYQELEHKVNATLNKLPPRCRQVFIMSRYDGLKYKEIGEILNISEKTVENQLVKALDILRTTLTSRRSKAGYPLSA